MRKRKRKINYRKGLLTLLTMSTLFLLSPEGSQQVEAATILNGSTQRAENGSNFWKTTNLREWLNSNSATVKYTNNAPNTAHLGDNAYDKEKGFLSNFTADEQNGIAVTKHRVQVQTNDARALNLPGSASPNHNTPIYHPSLAYSAPGLLEDYLNYYHQMVNDKVYLISTYEAYLYVQKRGFSLGKDPTEALKKKTGVSTIENWHLSGGEGHSGLESTYLASENPSFNLKGKPKLPAGIVPVIHLKPTYTLSNGKQGKNLAIGDVVTFGRYLNEPIQWRVINKTNNYPMLISEKTIDYKPIDAPGDLAYADSTSINFSSHEVDVSNYPEAAKSNNDTTMPTLTIVNGKELNVRKNNGFQLQLNASDNVGIDSVVLPNGSVVKGNNFTYTVTKNDEYTFIVKDVSGNHQYFVLPVGNINLPYTMQTTVNPTDWTSGNVSVKVNATNEGVGETRGVVDLNKRDSYLNEWSNYSTYMGKRVRISGNVEFVSSEKNLGNTVAKVGYRYTFLTYSNGNYNKGNTWVTGWEMTLSDLKAKGKQSFSFISTVPNDYFAGLQPWISMNHPHADNGNFKVKWTNLKYELIDDNDFSIQKIILPNGKSINGSNYTDTLTEYGTYKYQVVDNRNMTLSQNVTAKIDKLAPTLSLSSGHNTPTNADSQAVKVKAIDNENGSGVVKLKLPDGTFITNEDDLKKEVSYNVTENGVYPFIAYDKVGHSKELNVTVNNFDRTAPSGIISGNPTTWTRDNVTLTLTPADSGGSGYYRTKLPDGTYSSAAKPTYTVSDNGLVTFTVYDTAGNAKDVSITVNRIDKTNPLLELSKSNSSWTNENITLTAAASDAQSGLNYITLPNTTKMYSSSASQVVESNGTYTFKAIDHAGNEIAKSISVSNIDKERPSGSISGNPTSWTNGNVSLTLDTKDTGGSGYYRTKLPNGTYSSSANPTFTVTENGTYNFTIYDHAGNTKEVSTAVTKIDKTLPDGTISGNPISWVNSNITLTLSASDNGGSSYYRTKLPNGTYSTSTNPTYSVTENGTYTFTVYDNAGNSKNISTIVSKIERVAPAATISGNPTVWTNQDVTLKISPTDTGGSGYYRTKLPNGTLTTTLTPTYTVSSNGTYVFTVYDNAGNSKDVSIIVNKIDKVTPTGAISGNPASWTNQDVTLTLTPNDTGNSGYQCVKLPDGTYTTNTQPAYTVTGNGTYTFTIYDNAGNTKEVSVVVTKIDKTIPTLGRTEIKNITQDSFDVYVYDVKDIGGSDVNRVQFPTWTTENGQDDLLSDWMTNSKATGVNIGEGTWRFTIDRSEHKWEFGEYTIHIYAYDNAGNRRSISTTYHMRDQVKPTIQVMGNPDKWVNKNVTLTINGYDAHTGVKSITLPDGSVIAKNGDKGQTVSHSYVIVDNGSYTFKVTDMYDNVTIETVIVNKIDKKIPSLTIENNTLNWTNKDITLVINGADTASGVSHIVLPNGVISNHDKVSYIVKENGEYSFMVYDEAGNKNERKETVSLIDKILPSQSTIEIEFN